ncbi:MAG: haloacid dehalogenase-like hydrolase [Symbiobacteriaceae bacterium]|nr:haloacid dehalogenase-like hydrolase [Symbiobacteriaceae bacterium]
MVSDMDGTLLREDKSISQRTMQAIAQYEAAGGRFTVATGRNVEAAGQHLRKLGLRTPWLLLNGCLGYDAATDQDLFCRGLSRPLVEAVWPALLAHPVEVIVHGHRRAMTRGMNDRVAEHLQLDGITADVRPHLTPAETGDVVKILTIGEAAALDSLEATIRGAQLPVLLVRSHPQYLELLAPEGGKGTALLTLADHLAIARERTLAVGDYLNDVEMLQAAGLSVAMGNAHPAILQMAGRWTATNEEDGVALLLEALVAGRPVGVAPVAGAR